MREIKFKGKRIDNGGWAYGDLMTEYVHHEGLTIVENGCIYYEVDPETVGQDTGKKDLNNKEIYEGHIVEVTVYAHWDKGALNPQNIICKSLCPVVIQDFKIGVIHGERKEVIPFSGFHNTTFGIKGNIHDNPELLEGDEGE